MCDSGVQELRAPSPTGTGTTSPCAGGAARVAGLQSPTLPLSTMGAFRNFSCVRGELRLKHAGRALPTSQRRKNRGGTRRATGRLLSKDSITVTPETLEEGGGDEMMRSRSSFKVRRMVIKGSDEILSRATQGGIPGKYRDGSADYPWKFRSLASTFVDVTVAVH